MATTTNNGWVTPDNTAYVKDGASAIRSLGQSIDTSVGTGLLAWTSWTPTTTNITIGNGTTVARYAKLGKIVHFHWRFTLGSTSAVGSSPTFTLPVAKLATQTNINESVFYTRTGVDYPQKGIVYTSAGSDVLNLAALGTSIAYTNSALLTATIPFTWANTHVIEINGTYEAA